MGYICTCARVDLPLFHISEAAGRIFERNVATVLELKRALTWRTWDRLKRAGTAYFKRVPNRERQEVPNTVVRAASETLSECWLPLCRSAMANLVRPLVCWCVWSSGYTVEFSWKYVLCVRRYHVLNLKLYLCKALYVFEFT